MHAYFPRNSGPSCPLRRWHAHVEMRSADHPGWSGSGPVVARAQTAMNVAGGPGFVYTVSSVGQYWKRGRTGCWCLGGRGICGLCSWYCLGGLVLEGYDCGGRSACGLCGLYGFGGCWGGGGGGWGLSPEPKRSSATACRNEETMPMSKMKLRIKCPRVVHAEDSRRAR